MASLCQFILTPLVTPQKSQLLLQLYSLIKTQYELVIDFSSLDANSIIFNFSFSSNSDSNSNIELTEPACIPDNKKIKAKAKKDEREIKPTEAKKRKRVVVEMAKEKKRAETEADKEKKRAGAETLAQKKIDDKSAKNVETVLKKSLMSKHKTALLASNPHLKKKSQKTEKIEKPVINPNPEPKPTFKVNSLSKDECSMVY